MLTADFASRSRPFGESMNFQATLNTVEDVVAADARCGRITDVNTTAEKQACRFGSNWLTMVSQIACLAVSKFVGVPSL